MNLDMMNSLELTVDIRGTFIGQYLPLNTTPAFLQSIDASPALHYLPGKCLMSSCRGEKTSGGARCQSAAPPRAS
jgi:hypothetical protein